MAHFDIITAASNAYKTGWNERRYLLRLAAIPFAIKLVCFTLAAGFAGDQDHYLRFMLFMVPALLAEGWMLAHFTRLIVLGHRWPFRPTGDMEADMNMLSTRARGILSGMLVYTLINLAMGFIVAIGTTFLKSYIPDGVSPDKADIPPQVTLLFMLFAGFMFWGFRLLWLYIPYALNMDGRDYLSRLRGLSSSLHMIGVWMICFVPFFLALRVLAGLFGGVAHAAFGDSAASFVILFLTVVTDTAKSIMTTAGITYGLQQIFLKDKTIGR